VNMAYSDQAAQPAADHARSVVFLFGAEVETVEGKCGELRRLVVDPQTRSITHLVVGAAHHRTGGHLVPRGLVASVSGPVRLSCDRSAFDGLPLSESTEVLPVTTGSWAGGGAMGMGPRPIIVVDDQVPAGEGELSSSTPVQSTEGFAGHCGGVMVDLDTGRVHHVLLEQGHLWGRREVWIRNDDVTELGEPIRLGLTREQVLALPPHGHSHQARGSSGAEPAETDVLSILTTTMTVLPRG
jgi:sporulation protein YlmC with PRC-barrel domain